MSRFDRQKGVELETQPGMARRHEAVSGEFVRGAVMAGEAQRRPLLQIGARIHALREVFAVARAPGGVGHDPALRAAMTGFAAYTVRHRELGAAPLRSYIVRVAVQAYLGRRWIRQPQLDPDRARARGIQD